MRIKSTIKRMLPEPAQAFYLRMRNQQIQRQYRSLTLADAFAKIMGSFAWGKGDADGIPSSGFGSRGGLVEKWCLLLENQLRAYRVASIADLGCGDFTAGSLIARMGYTLIGVDIVQSVIDWNVSVHSSDHVRFVRADIASDPLPPADVAIVRQVLQHLSNLEVEAVLANILGSYLRVFITEHIYTGPNCIPNVDISHGPGTRVPEHSGVFVDRPPFSLPATSVGDIDVAPKEVLRTWMVGSAGQIS
jgi:SAM-dependent methyltransferase